MTSSAVVDIPTPDGAADAYLSRPDDGPHPGVLLIVDAFGLRPAIERIADRVASDGYVVLAPNIFYRAGRAPVLELPDLHDPEKYANTLKSVWPLVEQLTPERLASDGRAYLEYLEQVSTPGPVAITGYCMGGRAGWRIAAAYPDRVAALAAFHTAGLVTDEPDSPHRSARDLDAELYFGFADQDRNMTAEQIAALERTLEEAGARFRAEVYPGAQHGYAVADVPAYNEAASERHFRELHALLARALG
jgi:carboxymethylenebutenolidase